MHVRLTATALAFAFLLASTATAATDEWRMDLTASSVLGVGTAHLNGSFAMLIEEMHLRQTVPDPGFVLTATRLDVATDRADASLGPPVELYAEPRTDQTFHDNATAIGIAVRDHYRLLVVPLDPHAPPAVQVSSVCGQAEASAWDQYRFASHVKQRPDIVTDTSSALTWHSCDGQGDLTITGDFMVNLWDWDAHLTSPGRDETLWSGRQAFEGAQGTEGMIGRAQEHFLMAYNATLTLPAPSQSGQLHVLDADVSADRIAFADATGRIRGPATVDVEGQEVSFMGAEHVRLGSGLHVTYVGPARDLQVDGAAIAFEAGQDARGGFLWAWLGAVVAIGLVLVWRRHERASALARVAEWRLDEGRPWRSLVLVRLALVFSQRPQVRETHAKVCHELDHARAALRIHKRLNQDYAHAPRDRCRNAWGAMRIAQRHGLEDEAEVWASRANHYDAAEFQYLTRTPGSPDHSDAAYC